MSLTAASFYGAGITAADGAVLPVSAALVTSSRVSAPTTHHGRKEIPAAAPAACKGNACTGKNPQQEGCGSGATVLARIRPAGGGPEVPAPEFHTLQRVVGTHPEGEQQLAVQDRDQGREVVHRHFRVTPWSSLECWNLLGWARRHGGLSVRSRGRAVR
ncbi:hypothetical protein [Streptomyces sp. NPDC004267]|uniref:hypothetical protein n=1 Tax=Streptomyces sp. NPDC004267 TaxID=3364694 RepID=UPI00368E5A3E